ncbi:Phospholipase B1, membrane-associated [Sciurus carolinensis]|uniref:Phospholipase B1, membrane-associated n=1 Tax=Sciurus carolinensis TaxID=30640 RepID=A0AA41T093_SCICA|nr:Phospholipase B1, membrane-associated [Sciurus carolinensis]
MGLASAGWAGVGCLPSALISAGAWQPQERQLTSSMNKLAGMLDYLRQKEVWESLLASSRFNRQESFAVVFQPFFYEMSPSLERPLRQDPTTLALNLWNSMESPYLFTYRNSNYQNRMLQPQGKLEMTEGTEIICPDKDPSNTVPTSGNGAGSKPGDILDVLTQYRGLSWSVGGDENIRTVTTLANILREFNPALQGFSVGTGKENTPNAFLNQAVAGAEAQNLAAQARRLVDLMKNDTVLYSPQNFTNNIRKALDILHAEVPRAFVNLVKVLEIVSLRELYKENKVNCPRLILRSMCPCVLKFDDNSAELASLIDLNKKYQEGTQQLIDSGRYDTREDFTVVVQPFLENVDMPKTLEGLPDSSFFAPDCFHFSSKSHARAASGLWKNMLEPVGQKATRHKFEDKIDIVCPNQVWPFLSTYKNSVQAGNGIGSEPGDLLDVTTQYRGLSYSSGGDGSLENVTTLPNILREFNGNLTGYAVGTGDANDTNAFLNQAVPGAKTEQLVSQVQTLVQKMKDDHNLYSAANFLNHLRNALDILHREVPRALVNLVDFMNPSVIRQVFLENPDKCPVQQASILCNCVLTPREDSQELAKLEALARTYQSSMRQLVESGRYDTREDFSVVLQPFFLNIWLPVLQNGRPDMSFFAPDCIHPNQKFHSQLSRALWINMLEPVGRKTDTLDLTADMSLACPTQDEPFLRTYQNSNHTYPTKPVIENWGSDFLCTEWNSSGRVPTSVHELRPADIKVVAALGDSLTGTISTNSDLKGDILRKFNPSVFGFSTGTWEETAGLNVAVEGARARDMPAQARDLVERMKTSPEINLKKDWKLITLFIGGNDLCHYCENPEEHSTEEYVQHIQQALDILYDELPRAFINVVEVMELTSLYQGQDGKCTMLLAAQSNCTCFRHFQDSLAMQELKKVNWNLQSGLSRFSYWHRYMEREDFAVVVQPFLQNTLIPPNEQGGTDLTFFSEDCLYFSERSHAEMAIALWNNMLEPVGQKTTSNNFTHSRTKLKCPSSDNPYLYTLWNSGLLPDQAEEAPRFLYWAVPAAAVLGMLVGALAMMLWRGRRCHQRADPPMSMDASRF